MKFSEENKQVTEFSDKYFKFGVHKLLIGSITLDKTERGQEFIEVMVMDPTDAETTDTARVWFTSDAAVNYSFGVLRSIYVHNAPEDKKDKARADFDALSGTEELAELLQKLIGGEIWFTKYYDPERTYTAQDGKTKQSVNKNIYGYEPKLKPELMPKTGPADLGYLDAVMPGSKEVPFKSEGDAPGSTVPGDDAWS